MIWGGGEKKKDTIRFEKEKKKMHITIPSLYSLLFMCSCIVHDIDVGSGGRYPIPVLQIPPIMLIPMVAPSLMQWKWCAEHLMLMMGGSLASSHPLILS